MSPERAKVFFVEDDDDARETSTEFLEEGGHVVVETASSLDEALEKIPGLKEKDVDVAIVDGNLSRRDVSGRDGETIAKRIKAEHPSIVVIGHSLENPVVGADINCPKMEGSARLAEVVKLA